MNRAGNQGDNGVFYGWLLDICSPPTLDTGERVRRTLPGIVGILSSPLLFAYSFRNLYTGSFLLSALLFLTGVIVLASVLIGRRKEDVRLFYRLTMVSFGILMVYLMGILEVYPHHMFWSFVFPLASLYLLGIREGLLYIVIYYFILVFLVFNQHFNMLEGNYESRYKFEYLLSLFFVSLMGYCFEAIRFQYQETTKKRQSSLEAANDELRREIDKRKIMERAAKDALLELKETQLQLIQSAKLASIGELASGVAHELNQPLMVIRTHAQMALRGHGKQALSSEEAIEHIRPIEKNTKRMMNIINHLHIFARQSQKTFSPEDVNGIMKGCFLMIGEQLRVHNVHLMFELAESLPKVMGNANQLEQVFLNIIINARDAVLEGRTDEKGKGVIEMATRIFRGEREWVEILVRDTGKGISRKDLNRIFEPFFTTKEVGKGTGLGLSISYGIIKDHSGEIEVAETGPSGTTFRILLPVSAATVSGEEAE
ncbi:MAG: hypothetical protein GY846_17565 [Deltaproteobacteria bacterium]|nr:hypothetical protein [Deltaproteobacteria bacterium]